MTRLESNKVELPVPAKAVYAFLSDFSHFQKLMPPQVIDWSSDSDTCSFTIKGMASLGLQFESKKEFSEIVMKSAGKSPFVFQITSTITEAGPGSIVQLALDADLNPFLKMMAEKPLTNFLNLLVEKLKELV